MRYHVKFKFRSCYIIDNAKTTGRIAMLEVRTEGRDDEDEALARYIYSNHLQSAALELDLDANIISYEEYHPYGTTAYQATNSDIHAVAKRYRYTGKERDEETGLNYHGARYYAPWLGRWCAVDPLEGKYAPWSSYNYCEGNPARNADSSGMGSDDCIPSPKLLDGSTALYTFTSTTYDYKGNISSSTSNMSSEEIYGLPHGEYAQQTWLPDPNKPNVHDGSFVIANLPQTSTSFTPYCSESASSQSMTLGGVWNAFKAADPVDAGIIGGTVNFVSDALEGIWNVYAHPVDSGIGMLKFLYAVGTHGPLGIGMTPEARQLDMGIAQTIDRFENGDTYTRASMGTYAALTLGSFFVGGEGEVPGAVNKGIESANGIRITGFKGHAVDRAIGGFGRIGVKPNAILDALKNPLKTNEIVVDELGRPSQRFVGKFGEVVVNPQTGMIISVNPTSSSKALKLLKNRQ